MERLQDVAVSLEWRKAIQDKIKLIEKNENVKILLAVESGSRAWGFHSPDSDYDVRFIYVRSTDWHLSLGKKRNVIEYPVDKDWDLSGWELSKALQLALGSNAVVAEWLQSPIVYQEHIGFRNELLEFCADVLDRKSVTWHYLSLLRRQSNRSVDEKGNLKLKRYFYMLRPILALRWMRINEGTMPPMNIQTLMNGCDLDGAQITALNDLINKKKEMKEAETIGAVDNHLEKLINNEEGLARAWLDASTKKNALNEFWKNASAIHIKYTKAFDE